MILVPIKGGGGVEGEGGTQPPVEASEERMGVLLQGPAQRGAQAGRPPWAHGAEGPKNIQVISIYNFLFGIISI
jgi:hypothetical protein